MIMDEIGGSEKMSDKEDRLSDLPDPLVHHILSFLPSTKEAIRTGVLSKRWRHQWTHVPDLIFDFSDFGMPSNYSLENISIATSAISNSIDRILASHECSKIRKFHIISEDCYDYRQDPSCEDKLRFVIRKQAEDVFFKFYGEQGFWFWLPDFFFSQPSLVKLHMVGCSIMPIGMINWGSLKDLSIDCCNCSDKAIRSIVSGSPLLQSLEIRNCYEFGLLVISSKSLERLVLEDIDCYVVISCPNLVEFDVISGSSDTVLEKVISDCPLLESLKLKDCEFPKLRIAAKILKKMSLIGVVSREIEISCPCLEELDLSGLNVETLRLMNLPSSICVALDVDNNTEGCKEHVAKQILEQLQHGSELKLGSSFIGTLSALEMSELSYPMLNNKSLTLEGPVFSHIPGIICALRSSPVPEKLVVKLQRNECQKLADLTLADLSDMDHSGENSWDLNGSSFSSLVSHLRTVKITGFSQREDKPKLVLDFVEFILKNASVLEKMVVILEDCGTDFMIKVSQKVLSSPRCSSDAIVEVLCSN